MELVNIRTSVFSNQFDFYTLPHKKHFEKHNKYEFRAKRPKSWGCRSDRCIYPISYKKIKGCVYVTPPDNKIPFFFLVLFSS